MTNPISMPATVARFALVKKCSNQLETLCALKRISYTNVAVPKAGLVNQLIGLRGRSGRTIQNHLQWLLARGFIGDDGTCYFLRSWSTYEAQCGREIGWKGWNLRIRLYSGTSLKDLAFAYTVDSIKHSLNLSTKEREATVHEGGVSVSQLVGETGLGRATIVALKQRARRNKVLSYRKRYALVNGVQAISLRSPKHIRKSTVYTVLSGRSAEEKEYGFANLIGFMWR